MNRVKIEIEVTKEAKNRLDNFQIRRHIYDLLTENGYVVDNIVVDYLRKESER